MRVFLTSVGLLVLGLLIYAGCDNLAVERPDPIGFDFPYAAPGTGGTAGLAEAIVEMDGLIDGANANTHCLAPPISRADLDPLNARLDALLGQLGDGINRSNILDHVADLDSTDWVRMDSAAIHVLLDEYVALRMTYVAACPEEEALQTAAIEIFTEYTALISSLGSEGFASLIRETLNGQLTGPCEDACDQTRDHSMTKSWGQFAVVQSGCTMMLAGGPLGAVAASICTAGNLAVLTAEVSQARLDHTTCTGKCNPPSPSGAQLLLKSRSSL